MVATKTRQGAWVSLEAVTIAEILTALDEQYLGEHKVAGILHDGANYVAVYRV